MSVLLPCLALRNIGRMCPARTWSMYVAVLAIVVAPLLAACSLTPCVERRHESGLLIVCPEPVEPYAAMPEEIKAAASSAWAVADDNPDDLGYPWADPATNDLEIRVVRPRGEAVVRDWMAGNAVKFGPKAHAIPPPSARVTFVATDRSIRQLQEIQHSLAPPKDLPDGDAVFMTGPDRRRNATVIGVDRLSDRLMRALAARYGTSAIVIHYDPDPARPRIGP